MNRINKLIISTVCAAVTVSLSGCNQAKKVEPTVRLNPQALQVVQLSDTQNNASKHFSGVVRSKEQTSLAFRVPGTIEHIYVAKGQSVTQGQVIARLDPHDYQVALEELEAKMLEAQSVHKLAKSELARVKQATADDAIAPVNLDRAISGYERSLSAVKVVEKNIQRAHNTLAYTEIKAPFDGVIGRVDYEVHEQILPGIALATLQDNAQLEVEVDVPETLIDSLELGQIGQVSWYRSDQSLTAYVTEISPLPHLIKQTYTVTYRIEQGETAFFPGKSVSLSTKIGPSNPGFCLPYSALIGQKDEMHVNVVRDNAVVRTEVNLNSLDAYQACVVGELNANDYVVVSGSHYLSDGDKVDHIIVRQQ